MRQLVVIFVLAVAVFASRARAGTIIVVSTRAAVENSSEQLSTIYLDDRMMRFETAAGGSRVIIISRFVGEEPVYWVIDQPRGTYYEITQAEVVAMKEQMDQLVAMIEAQMKQLPPEDREKMEVYKKRIAELGQTGITLRYERLATGVEVGDWSCSEYKGYYQGKVREHLWTASFEDLRIDPDDMIVFEKMGDLFQAMGQEMSGFFQVKAKGKRGKFGFEGFPVRVVTLRNGKQVDQSIVTDIRRLPLDKELFQLPPHLRKEVFIRK